MIRSIAIGVTAFALGGCPCVATNVEYACQTSSQCASGQVCTDGLCGPPGASSTTGSSTSGGLGTTGATTGGASSVGSTGASTGVVATTGTGATTGAATSTSGATTAGTGVTGTTGAVRARVLATAQTSTTLLEVWDVTNPASVTQLVSYDLGGGPTDLPAAVARSDDGNILVHSTDTGLLVFTDTGDYIGQILVPWADGAQGGTGLVYLSQDAGPALVVACDVNSGMTAFLYGGASDFNGASTISPAALWTSPAPSGFEGFEQCFAGPSNTFFVPTESPTAGYYVAWYDAATGEGHNGGAFIAASKMGLMRGGAMDPTTGDVLIGGNPPDYPGGVVELFDSSGNCLAAFTSGACKNTDCTGSCVCTSNSAAIALEINSVAWVPDAGFLGTTVNAIDAGVGNVILALPSPSLQPATYYTGAPGLSFFGLWSSF